MYLLDGVALHMHTKEGSRSLQMLKSDLTEL